MECTLCVESSKVSAAKETSKEVKCMSIVLHIDADVLGTPPPPLKKKATTKKQNQEYPAIDP